MGDFNTNDPYERDQQRLLQLLDEVLTDEEKDPYEDSDGEYGSDKNYEYESSSESEESISSDDLDVSTLSKNLRTASRKKSSIQEDPNRQTTPVPKPSLDDGVVSPEGSPLASPRLSSPLPSDTDSWEPTIAPISEFNFDNSSNRLKINIGPE